MTTFGIDQSSRPPPSAAALVKAGVAFCNHYVADRWTSAVVLDDPATWPTKCLRPAEVKAYVKAGIQVFTNWETSADAMKAGYNRGQSAAANAAHMARLCGAPADMVIYFSADWPATYDEYTGGIAPFLKGAHSVLGLDRGGKRRTALYGGIYPVTWAFRDGLIDRAWQTAAWSGDPPTWHAKAQIRQYPDAPRAYHVTIDGVRCDIDRAMTADFGQWPAQGGLTMADAQDILDRLDWLALWAAGRANRVFNPPDLAERLSKQTGDHIEADFDVPTSPASLKEAFTSVMDKLDQGLTVGLTPEQVAEIKQALVKLEGSALVQLAVSPAP